MKTAFPLQDFQGFPVTPPVAPHIPAVYTNGQDIILLCRSNFSLSKGAIVKVTSGVVSGTNAGNNSIYPAVITVANTSDAQMIGYTFGVVLDNSVSTPNQFGTLIRVQTYGIVKPFDCSSFNAGQVLYFAGSSGLTATSPSLGSGSYVLPLAICLQPGANGSIFLLNGIPHQHIIPESELDIGSGAAAKIAGYSTAGNLHGDLTWPTLGTGNIVWNLPDLGANTPDTIVLAAFVQLLSNKKLQDSTTTIVDNADNTKAARFEASGITAGQTRVLTIPDSDLTIVGVDVTQTLTNKKLVDNSTTIVDNGDNTKAARFEVSGITAGQTRVLTVQDQDTTLVGRDTTDTLTNKTLTSPTINTPVITVKDTDLTIEDDGDTSKKFKFQASDISASTTRTYTVPNADTTLVGTDTTQTLTNKSIAGSEINSGTVAAARLGVMTGDSGSGGASGAAPAPATGDASKYLRGDATYAIPGNKFAILEDQKTQNTAGGGSTATTWSTRDLNTEVADADNIVSISSNLFTPIAGTYRITATSPYVSDGTANVNSVRTRLWNNTQSSEVSRSINVFLNNTTVSVGGVSSLDCIFTANGTDAYAIQYWVTRGKTTNGLGIAINETSAVERYLHIVLEKMDS